MLVTMPAMFLLSKLDYEDPMILTLCRVAFVVAMGLKYLLHKLALSKIASTNNTEVIFVPVAQPSMFGPTEPKEDSPRKKTTYRQHEEELANAQVQQVMVTSALMLFLSWKMGMHLPLPLQVVMGAMELVTSPVIKQHVFGMTIERPYKELKEGEPGAVATADAAAADGAATATDATAGSSDINKKMREAVVEAWDSQKPFEAGKFAELKKEGADMNTQTVEDKWTVLMIAAGTRGCTAETFAELLKLGAQRDVTDSDGWTALHWSAYHGNLTAIKALLAGASDAEEAMLLDMKCNRGQTAMEVANDALASSKEKLEAAEKANDASKVEQAKSVLQRQQETVELLKLNYDAAAVGAGADAGIEEAKGDEAPSGLRHRGKPEAEDDIQDID